MPLYAADTALYPGAEIPPEFPCQVLDGAGAEVPDCLLIDTDTGRVIRERCDDRGEPVIDHATGAIALVVEIRPLPLRLVPLDWVECHIVEASPAHDD